LVASAASYLVITHAARQSHEIVRAGSRLPHAVARLGPPRRGSRIHGLTVQAVTLAQRLL